MPLITDYKDLAKLFLAQSGSPPGIPEGVGDLRERLLSSISQNKAPTGGLGAGLMPGMIPQASDVGRPAPPSLLPTNVPQGKPPAIPQEDMFNTPSMADAQKKQDPTKPKVPPVATPTVPTTPTPSRETATTPEPHPFEGQYTVNPNAAPDQAAFVQMMTPHVQQVALETGLDPRLIMAQAILESGAGKHAPGFNYFGIKAAPGTPGAQELETKEEVNGKVVPTKALFRTYKSPLESVKDYGTLLKTDPHYASVVSAKGLEAQLAALEKSGYATDSTYGKKLREIIAGLKDFGTTSAEPDTRKRGGRIESSGRHARDLLALSRGYR